MRKFVLMVAAIPPPVTGRSAAAAEVIKLLEAGGLSVSTFDTLKLVQDKAGPARWNSIAGKVWAFLRFFVAAARQRDQALAFIVLSGGAGLVVDAAFAAVARLFQIPILFHHHSFAYLNRRSALANWTFRLAGARAAHVVLCDCMRDRLTSRYPVASRTLVLSNMAITPLPISGRPRTGPVRTIGYLSNITFEKGIDCFIALAQELRRRGVDVRCRVAGPVLEAACQPPLDAAIEGGVIEYVGPVYDSAKESFLRDMDVFVLPSRYPNEAEPFVILEALVNAVPVVSTDRGCIPTMLDSDCGLLMDAEASDWRQAADRIEQWARDRAFFGRASAAALSRAEVMLAQSVRQKKALLDAIAQS